MGPLIRYIVPGTPPLSPLPPLVPPPSPAQHPPHTDTNTAAATASAHDDDDGTTTVSSGDGDEERHPNVFRLKGNVAESSVTLEQIKDSFLLPGEYHFRFKTWDQRLNRSASTRTCYIGVGSERGGGGGSFVRRGALRIRLRRGKEGLQAELVAPPPSGPPD